MASIKISALGELELDRLTDADVFIVNDQDATTQKITFETLKGGLDRDARYFTGPVEFGNTVIFNGPLGGRNVYTKDETLNEITLALQPVKDDVLVLEQGQDKIKTLLGEAGTAGQPEILGGVFSTPNMRSSGPYTIEKALKQLDIGAGLNTQQIEANLVLINTLSTRVGDLDRGVATDAADIDDGRVTIAERDIIELKGIVGLDGQNITDNTDNITQNSDYITNLHTMVGALEGQPDMLTAFTNLPAPIAGKASLTAAVDAVNNNVISNTTEISDVNDRAATDRISIQENHEHVRELLVVIQNTCAAFAADGAKTTADELATDISAAIADAVANGSLPNA